MCVRVCVCIYLYIYMSHSINSKPHHIFVVVTDNLFLKTRKRYRFLS